MKILVTGASGLVGAALGSALARDGHTVCRLVRPGSRTASETRAAAGAGFDVPWNPATGELGGAGVGADAVVHLAGAPIAEERWTTGRKELLRSSRVETTRALVNALAKMSVRPRVLVCASATGYYGDRGEEVLTEESPAGTDFLAGIGQQWEAEAAKAEVLGIRVVRARLGMVLAKHGGALAKMLLPFRLGVGGHFGSGRQWMSWVTLEDVVAILRFALEEAPAGSVLSRMPLSGAVNVVAPQPVRNTEFTQALARALHRPAIFPVPSLALRLTLGEMAGALLLSSQRVLPQKLEQCGFRFRHPELQAALAAVLAAE
jgi:uncharacterized protein (TIGR01777 family)